MIIYNSQYQADQSALIVDDIFRLFMSPSYRRQITVRFARSGELLGVIRLLYVTVDVTVQAIEKSKIIKIPNSILETKAKISNASSTKFK